MEINFKTIDLIIKENWNQEEIFCPNCGKKGLYSLSKKIPNKDFDGIMTNRIYLCVNCRKKIQNDIKILDANMEWDIQRIKLIKGAKNDDI